MFLPGETIIHEFILPIPKSEVKKVVVTYEQNDRLVITPKVIGSGSVLDYDNKTKSKVQVALTQTESLLFESPEINRFNKNSVPFTVQVNVYTTSGSRLTSIPASGATGIQHYREAIS